MQTVFCCSYIEYRFILCEQIKEEHMVPLFCVSDKSILLSRRKAAYTTWPEKMLKDKVTEYKKIRLFKLPKLNCLELRKQPATLGTKHLKSLIWFMK